MNASTIDGLRWRFRAWRYRCKLEPAEVALVREYIQPGDIVLDVGAHKGAYTWWMRQGVGAKGQVYAFEPQAILAEALRSLVAQRNWTNVRVESLGLSSRPSNLPLLVPRGGTSPGASFERPAGKDLDGEIFNVPVTTVDDWLEEHDHRQVRLIKVDVEGHELEVFRGATRTLSRHRPALLFECEQRHRESGDMDDVFRFLAQHGYEGQAVTRRGLLALEKFDTTLHQRDDGPLGYVNNFWFQSALTR